MNYYKNKFPAFQSNGYKEINALWNVAFEDFAIFFGIFANSFRRFPESLSSTSHCKYEVSRVACNGSVSCPSSITALCLTFVERYGWRIGWRGARCGRRDEKSERSGGGAARPETMAIDLPRGRRRNRKLPMNRDDRWKLALLKRLVIFLAAFVGGRWALRSSQRSLPRAAVLQSRISPRPFPSIYRVTTATNTTTIIVIIMVFLCQIAPVAWHVRSEWVVLRFGAL